MLQPAYPHLSFLVKYQVNIFFRNSSLTNVKFSVMMLLILLEANQTTMTAQSSTCSEWCLVFFCQSSSAWKTSCNLYSSISSPTYPSHCDKSVMSQMNAPAKSHWVSKVNNTALWSFIKNIMGIWGWLEFVWNVFIKLWLFHFSKHVKRPNEPQISSFKVLTAPAHICLFFVSFFPVREENQQPLGSSCLSSLWTLAVPQNNYNYVMLSVG